MTAQSPAYRHPHSRLLDGMGGGDLTAILAAAREQSFAANSVIVHQTHRADCLFLLTKGQARHFYITEDGRKILMRWLVPGDITGAAALLSKPWRYLVSTEAVKDSRLLVWNRADIGRLAVRFPKLLHNAMFIAADYLEWYLTAHLALMCHSDRQRCASVLVSISRAVGQKVTGGIELRITNEELANAAGITLFAVSRFMSEWQRLGAIAKSRGKVLLRSVNMLHREARR